MRALVRPLTMSLSLLVAVALAPLAARAQTDPNQPYQPQPGYQQPQQYPQPGYQQPQQYPQQGYQQPQQAYPQQQYPQQGYQQPQPYPQQGYAPQGYAPQGNPPPPGYYAPQPQPAYGQPPAYAPQPAYAPPPAGAGRRGFLFMPYLGVNVPVGDGSDGFSTGLRLGGIMGAMVGSLVSLNGELMIDVLNLDTAPGVSATMVEVDLTFSPLFHLSLPGLEIVVGPRLGIFGMSGSSSSDSSSSDLTYSGSGVTYGLNTGVFIPVGRMAIGGILSFTGRSYSSACDNSAGYEICGDVSSNSPDAKSIGLTGALIF